MKEPFAYSAVLAMPIDGDTAAPGGAITVALCGSWEHDGPCPLAPHHTRVARGEGDELHLRTLFAAEPSDLHEVEQRIHRTLVGAAGWELVRAGLSPVEADEADHARRLADG